MRAEKSIVINNPIEKVFAYSQDKDNYTAWQKDAVSMQMIEGPDNKVGSRYVEVRKFLGQN